MPCPNVPRFVPAVLRTWRVLSIASSGSLGCFRYQRTVFEAPYDDSLQLTLDTDIYACAVDNTDPDKLCSSGAALPHSAVQRG